MKDLQEINRGKHKKYVKFMNELDIDINELANFTANYVVDGYGLHNFPKFKKEINLILDDV